MGIEAPCKLRYDGKSFFGKALLETSEILFRGETRLKIPFPAITKLQARAGELHVRTKEGVAIFALGPQAEKWREKIAHPKTLIDKLGVKPGETVSLVGDFPGDFVATLEKQRAAIVHDKTAGDVRWYFLAAESCENLRRIKGIATSLNREKRQLREAKNDESGRAAGHREPSASLWIVYPKGRSSVTEGQVRSAGLAAGLTDIKVAGFSATHTALKFVVPKSKR